MKLKYYLYVGLIVLLSFFSFYPAFSFAFIIDDWHQLWGVFYDKSIIDYYILTQHPNSAYEFLLLAPIFRFNPFYYQIIGFVLKIIASLSVAVVVLSITRLKTAAAFSGLIFASSVIGIETFTRISAHNSALLIPIVCLSVYLWITAERENSIYKYILVVLFIILTIINDPGPGIVILPIIFLWNLLLFIQEINWSSLKNFLIKTAFLLTILISLKWYLAPRIANRNEPIAQHIQYLLSNTSVAITNFLTSLGNLVVGWIFPIKEHIGLTSPTFITTVFGYLLSISALLLGYKFLQKKSNFLGLLFFFVSWIFLFYFPSWFTQGHYVLGGTISAVSNRYLALSSIGFIAFIAYLVTCLKRKHAYLAIVIIIMLNIISSYRILNEEYKYRSLEIQNKLYSIIDQDLPKGNEKEYLILFLGNNALKIFGLEWNGFYPIALRRGITDKKEFPTIVNNLIDAKNLLCTDGSPSSEPQLSKLYAWEVENNGMIYNVTEDVKLLISKECKLNPYN